MTFCTHLDQTIVLVTALCLGASAAPYGVKSPAANLLGKRPSVPLSPAKGVAQSSYQSVSNVQPVQQLGQLSGQTIDLSSLNLGNNLGGLDLSNVQIIPVTLENLESAQLSSPINQNIQIESAPVQEQQQEVQYQQQQQQQQQVQYQQAVQPVQISAQPISQSYSTKGGTKGAAVNSASRSQNIVSPVYAAVVTKRTQEFIDAPVTTDVVQPQVVIVEPNLQPITIEFRSRSSPVQINQVHVPGDKGTEKITRSEEEPDRVIHEVVKPVIQEVREIIQPFRKITQQILPVQEEVHSVITRGQRKQVIEQAKVEAPVIEQQQIEQIPDTGTIVQAGLIGGARVLPMDSQIVQQLEEFSKRAKARRA